MAEDVTDYGSARLTLEIDDSEAERQARDVGADIERALTRATRNIGRNLQRNITRGLRRLSVAARVTPNLDRFERELRSGLRGLDAVPVPVGPDVGRFDREVRNALRGMDPVPVPVTADARALRRSLRTGRRDAVPVQVTPDLRGFARRLQRALRGVEAEIRVRADARRLVREIETALREVDPPRIRARVDADVSGLQSELNSLNPPRIEVSITLDTDAVRQQIQALADTELNIPVTIGGGGGAAAAGAAAGAGALGGLTGALTAAGPWGAVVGAVAAYGALIGKALMTGIEGVIEHQRIEGQLRAALGLAEDDAAQAGRVVGQLYARGVVETVEDGTAAVQAAIRNGLAAPDDLPGLEKISAAVADLGGLMEEDIGKVARAVGTMVKTGLVDDAGEAVDLLTTSVQRGGNVAEDLLDTFTEYPTQFRQLGISAEEAFGLIQQGLEGGARDSDVIADALKEFSIEAAQGGKRVTDAFAAMNLDAGRLTAAFAEGGPAARDALQEIFDELQQIEDPLERNQAAVGLFGTKAEDLAGALGNLDLRTATQEVEGFGGAAEKAGDALRDNLGDKITRIGRELKQAFQGLFTGDFSQFGDVGDAISDALPDLKETGAKIAKSIEEGIIEYGPRVFEALFNLAFSIGERVDIWGPLLLKITIGAAALPAVIGGLLLTALVGGIAGIGAKLLPYLEEAWNGVANFFTETIPQWGSEIGGDIADALSGAWDRAAGAVSDGVDSVVEFVTELPGRIVEGAGDLAGQVGEFFSGAFDSAKEAAGRALDEVVQFFTELPGRIWNALTELPSLLYDAFTSAIAFLIIGILTAIAGVVFIFTELPFRIWDALVGLGETLVSAFETGWAAVTSWLATAFDNTVQFISTLPQRAYNALIGFGTWVLTALSTGFTAAYNRVVQWVGQAASYIGQLPSRAYNALVSLGAQIVSALSAAFTSGYNRVVQWVGQAASYIGQLPGRAANALSSLASRIGGAISSAAGAARRAASRLIDGVVNLFRGLPDAVARAVGNLGSTIMSKVKSGLPSSVAKFLPFADGGIVTSPVLGLVGEAGPEVIIPLSRPRRAQELAQESGLVSMLARAGVLAPPAGGDSGGRQRAGAVHNHTWNLYEVGDANTTAQRVINRLVLSAAL